VVVQRLLQGLLWLACLFQAQVVAAMDSFFLRDLNGCLGHLYEIHRLLLRNARHIAFPEGQGQIRIYSSEEILRSADISWPVVVIKDIHKMLAHQLRLPNEISVEILPETSNEKPGASYRFLKVKLSDRRMHPQFGPLNVAVSHEYGHTLYTTNLLQRLEQEPRTHPIRQKVSAEQLLIPEKKIPLEKGFEEIFSDLLAVLHARNVHAVSEYLSLSGHPNHDEAYARDFGRFEEFEPTNIDDPHQMFGESRRYLGQQLIRRAIKEKLEGRLAKKVFDLIYEEWKELRLGNFPRGSDIYRGADLRLLEKLKTIQLVE
jgi:hypothetical protein